MAFSQNTGTLWNWGLPARARRVNVNRTNFYFINNPSRRERLENLVRVYSAILQSQIGTEIVTELRDHWIITTMLVQETRARCAGLDSCKLQSQLDGWRDGILRLKSAVRKGKLNERTCFILTESNSFLRSFLSESLVLFCIVFWPTKTFSTERKKIKWMKKFFRIKNDSKICYKNVLKILFKKIAITA